MDEVGAMLKGFLTGGGNEGPPDLLKLLQGIAKQDPIPLEHVSKNAGPLLLNWEQYSDDKEEKEMVHAKLEAPELEKSTEVKADARFTVCYSDPAKKDEQIARVSAAAVLLARWQFMRFANKPSKERKQIRSMLADLNEMDRIDLAPEVEEVKEEDLGVWKNVSVAAFHPGIELSSNVISEIKEGTLVYPLERRTISDNVVRYRISKDSENGWISETRDGTKGAAIFTKVEEETEEMIDAKGKAVKGDKEKREKEAKRPLQYDYLLQQIKNGKK